MKILILLLLSALLSPPAFSQSEAKKSWMLSVGFGAAVKNNMRKQNLYSKNHADILFSPIPILQFRYGPLSIGEAGLSLSVIGDREASLYVNMNRNSDRHLYNGMEGRKNSWFFGLGGKFKKYSFLLAKDIQGRSHGYKLNLTYAEMYPMGEHFFTRSSVGLQCSNKSYNDYYFGVKDSEVQSSQLNEYHPNGFCVPTMAFIPIYKYNENLSFMAGNVFKFLPSALRDSPTIRGGNLEVALILGALWNL